MPGVIMVELSLRTWVTEVKRILHMPEGTEVRTTTIDMSVDYNLSILSIASSG